MGAPWGWNLVEDGKRAKELQEEIIQKDSVAQWRGHELWTQEDTVELSSLPRAVGATHPFSSLGLNDHICKKGSYPFPHGLLL